MSILAALILCQVPALPDPSRIEITAPETAELMLIAPDGTTTGFIVAEQAIRQGIPRSSVVFERPLPTRVGRETIRVARPAPGTYTLRLVRGAATYARIRTFSGTGRVLSQTKANISTSADVTFPSVTPIHA